MNEELDPQVVNLTKAIRQAESNGNFNVRSKDGSFGAYQFIKPTWDATSKKFGVNAEWDKATPQQQNEVAYKQVKEWKDKGYNVGQIASMWNAGAGRPDAYLEGLKGTNKDGVNYDVSKYAEKVATTYQTLKNGGQLPPPPEKTFGQKVAGVGAAIVNPLERLGQGILNQAAPLFGLEKQTYHKGIFGNDVDTLGYKNGTALGGKELAKDVAGNLLQNAANLPLFRGAGLTYQGLKTAVKGKSLAPIIGGVKQLAKEGAAAGGLAFGGSALEQQKTVPRALGEGLLGAAGGAVAGPILGAGIPLVTRGAMNIPKLKRALTPTSEGLLNRSNRLTPTQANNFMKLSGGESHGAYLERTGNFGTPQETVANEATKFVNSLKEVDDTLASIQGTYKSKPQDLMLDDLVAREASIGVPNGESSAIARLYNKNKTQGLTMEEGNYLKRLYERTVKLGYQKEQNSIGIARSTRIDDAFRKWQFKTAKENGFTNLDALNKQTQLSRFIVDKLGSQIGGKTGNEAISLTDWIVLSGLDPTAIGAFFLKRGILDKGFQAGLAKVLSKKTPVGAVKANVKPLLKLPAPKRGALRSEVKSGKAINLPSRSSTQTNRTEIPQVKLLSNKSKISYKNTLPLLAQKGKGSLGDKFRNQGNQSAAGGIAGLETDEDGKITYNAEKGAMGALGMAALGSKGGKKLTEGLTKKAGELYKETGNLTTKLLKDLEGKSTVSKQYILDATNRGELKQPERDLFRRLLNDEGNTVNVPKFAEKVKAELLPLTVKKPRPYKIEEGMYADGGRYENIALPDEVRGKVANYKERIYESPISTSAGNVHFGSESKNYFGHTRIEDMADNQTRRVIEVQSDLYQKGRLEKEVNRDIDFPEEGTFDEVKAFYEKTINDKNVAENVREATKEDLADLLNRKKQISKLEQYNDPTAHFRMIREEIKKAAEDGKTKLQFPTGETAMKIEGLSDNRQWFTASNVDGYARTGGRLTPDNLKVGEMANGHGGTWIITDVLGDGKFKAMPKEHFDSFAESKGVQDLTGQDLISYAEQHGTQNFWGSKETFDISGKVDTNNPIYKFYEKEVQNYLKKFGGKEVVDDKGVSWIEIPIGKNSKGAVEAFGLLGAVGLGAAANQDTVPKVKRQLDALK